MNAQLNYPAIRLQQEKFYCAYGPVAGRFNGKGQIPENFRGKETVETVDDSVSISEEYYLTEENCAEVFSDLTTEPARKEESSLVASSCLKPEEQSSQQGRLQKQISRFLSKFYCDGRSPHGNVANSFKVSSCGEVENRQNAESRQQLPDNIDGKTNGKNAGEPALENVTTSVVIDEQGETIEDELRPENGQVVNSSFGIIEVQNFQLMREDIQLLMKTMNDQLSTQVPKGTEQSTVISSEPDEGKDFTVQVGEGEEIMDSCMQTDNYEAEKLQGNEPALQQAPKREQKALRASDLQQDLLLDEQDNAEFDGIVQKTETPLYKQRNKLNQRRSNRSGSIIKLPTKQKMQHVNYRQGNPEDAEPTDKEMRCENVNVMDIIERAEKILATGQKEIDTGHEEECGNELGQGDDNAGAESIFLTDEKQYAEHISNIENTINKSLLTLQYAIEPHEKTIKFGKYTDVFAQNNEPDASHDQMASNQSSKPREMQDDGLFEENNGTRENCLGEELQPAEIDEDFLNLIQNMTREQNPEDDARQIAEELEEKTAIFSVPNKEEEVTELNEEEQDTKITITFAEDHDSSSQEQEETADKYAPVEGTGFPDYYYEYLSENQLIAPEEYQPLESRIYTKAELQRLKELKKDLDISLHQSRKTQYGEEFLDFYESKIKDIVRESIEILTASEHNAYHFRESAISKRSRILM